MAEIGYTPFGRKGTLVRLIVRRVPPRPAASSPSSPPTTTTPSSATGRARPLRSKPITAVTPRFKNVIRDLKYGVGLNHLPSGKFGANAAWLAFQVMAHNLGLWVNRLGLQGAPLRMKTLRCRYLISARSAHPFCPAPAAGPTLRLALAGGVSCGPYPPALFADARRRLRRTHHQEVAAEAGASLPG